MHADVKHMARQLKKHIQLIIHLADVEINFSL